MPLQENLGTDFILADQDEDGVYEITNAVGDKIEGMIVFQDGSASLDYQGTELVQPHQVIKAVGGKLVYGVWEFNNGAWGEAVTRAAGEGNLYSLGVIRGHEKEEAMKQAIWLARDQGLSKPGYDPASEFEGISVEYNGEVHENFEVKPVVWRMVNMERYLKGAFMFEPRSGNSSVVYKDGSSHVHARPMQVALGSGWFNVEIYNNDGSLFETAVHAPVIAKNGNRSISKMSALVGAEYMAEVAENLAKTDRGKIDIWLYNKIQKYEHPDIMASDALLGFMVGVNNDYFFDHFDEPGVAHGKNLGENVPKGLSNVLCTLMVQIWR